MMVQPNPAARLHLLKLRLAAVRRFDVHILLLEKTLLHGLKKRSP